MELIIKLQNNSKENDISRIVRYLKAQKCVRKFDLVSNELNTVKTIFDKETVDAINFTSTKALTDFLKNETESIF